MKYLVLIGAIIFEIIGTAAVQSSHQFSRLKPSLLAIGCFAIVLFLFSLTLKQFNLGISYALWSGLGIVAVSILAAIRYKQMLDTPALLGIGLIIIGVVVIMVFSKSAVHA